MNVAQIYLRVKAKTAEGDYRIVSIDTATSAARCDCNGFDGVICSHIDAVLISCEDAMVADDDVKCLPAARLLMQDKIAVPDTWRASWRRDFRWRGLSRAGQRRRIATRKSDRPLVCFTGKIDRVREEMLLEAKANGWDVVDGPSPFTDVLVLGELKKESAKLKLARKNGVSVVTPDEWAMLMTDGVLPE